MVKLTTLMDNLSSSNKSLRAEHGLSFFIETEDIKILFDFGCGYNFVHNAKTMGVPIESADFCICSHGHYDHAAGYKYAVEEGVKAPLITGKGFLKKKYSKNGLKYTYSGTGFSAKYLEEKGIEHRICDEVLQISPKCWVVTNFERNEKCEKIPEKFVVGELNKTVPDDFSDEVCFVTECEKGLVVVVGCSHPGIINILNTVRKRFNKPIYAAIGGTHLVVADEKRISYTLKTMKDMGIGMVGFNHCSGSLAKEMIEKDSEIQSFYLAVGDCIKID